MIDDPRWEIEALLLKASVEDALGDTGASSRALERELELAEPDGVLRYLPTNLRTPQIAAELFVSRNTIRTHIRNAYSKLGVHSHADAINRARELSLLSPSSRAQALTHPPGWELTSFAANRGTMERPLPPGTIPQLGSAGPDTRGRSRRASATTVINSRGWRSPRSCCASDLPSRGQRRLGHVGEGIANALGRLG